MIAAFLFIWFGFGILGIIFHALHEYHNTYISYGDLLDFFIGMMFGPLYALFTFIALTAHSNWWLELKHKVLISKDKRNGSD